VNLDAIRIKCAELVGWRRADLNHELRTFHYVFNKKYVLHSAGDICDWLPNYPESADAALQLVEWMSKPENGGWILESNFNGREWSAQLIEIIDGKTNHWITKFANTFALAICLAFLKANNIEPDLLQTK